MFNLVHVQKKNPAVASAGKTDKFERSLQEVDSLLEQSFRLEQKDDLAAALNLCNEAVCK